jgi:hypothetical protein
MVQYNYIIRGTLLYLIASTIVMVSNNNGQFLTDWIKQHPLTMSLLGVPISYVYIYATKDLVEAFDGDLWPQRLIGFSMGMVAFAFLTWIHFQQAITLKTAVTLALATAIVVIQIVWK